MEQSRSARLRNYFVRQKFRPMNGSSFRRLDWRKSLAIALAFFKGGVSSLEHPSAQRLWAFEPLEPRQLLSVAPGMVPVGSVPDGALSDKIVYVSAGHGWQWNNTLNRWATDRPNLLSMVEDFGNQDQLTYYADFLLRSGATVVPMRPVGRQTNEVVLDNDSPGVTWSGSWSNNTAGPRWYDEDYGAGLDGVKYRFASINGNSESAVATYTPAMPQSGFYPVYSWVSSSSNRTNQLYKINHTGGQTQIRVDHRKVGNGWVYLGTYFFAQGSSPERGSVQISNFSQDGGSVVIADAIRFGNGMGDLPWGSSGIGSGNISGYPREDEGSIVWLWRGIGQSTTFSSPSTILGTSNVSAPLRMADHMNASTNAYGTSIYVGFHSNATTGNPDTATARGAIGLVHTSSPTPNQSALAVAMGRQINVDLRALDGRFEHNWSTRTTYSLAGSYGEITNSIADGNFDATIVEVAFHDNTQDAQLLRDPKVREQLGRSTYEATLEHLHNFPGTTGQPPNITVPSPPALRRVTSEQSGAVTLHWTPGPSSSGGFSGVHGSPATGFRIYASTDGYGFDGGTYVAGGNIQTVTLNGYDPARTYFFKVVAENAGGQSVESEVLTVLPNGGQRSILIVSGFDRLERSQNFRQPYAFGGGGTTERVWGRFNNSRDYPVQLHHAIAEAIPGMSVDSASNESIANGEVSLNNYQSVFWILGNESVADQSLSGIEQTLVANFIAAGGNFFASGSELAYDLDAQNNGRSFYRGVLGASYVSDSAATYQVLPDNGGIFAGLNPFSFSNGSAFSSLVDQMLNIAFPDKISPSPGSQTNLQYQAGAGGIAGIQRVGSQGAGNTVVLGFPWESIVGRETRAASMARILDFFGHSQTPQDAVVVGSHAYHANSVFAASGLDSALDTVKVLAKEGSTEQTLDFDNVINSTRGINGLVFDVDGLGGTVSSSDFVFQVSPTGAFDVGANPPFSWGLAANPQSVSVIQGSPSRIVIQWPDQAIANRWLRITVLANENTGLPEPEVYYLGHLTGETTGVDQGFFVVTFADITAIRAAVGSTVSVSSVVDTQKDGVVSFADIAAMRENIAAILPAITIPQAASSAQGSQGGSHDGLGGSAGQEPIASDVQSPASVDWLILDGRKQPGMLNRLAADRVDAVWLQLSSSLSALNAQGGSITDQATSIPTRASRVDGLSTKNLNESDSLGRTLENDLAVEFTPLPPRCLR